MTKRFSSAELAKCAYACYRDGIVCGHGFMGTDFMKNTAPEIKDKYIKMSMRDSWKFRNAISEIVYDNLKLLRAYYNDPNNKDLEQQIVSLFDIPKFVKNAKKKRAS